MVKAEEALGQEDWKEKCFILEALLMKFRVQIIKIREQTRLVLSNKLYRIITNRTSTLLNDPK
uniref:Uncharacterized protein n=1 Tax=Oncorhynchus tshawytscha TaxID=74940 RepID=A0AAZ3R3F2_ONCTS